MALPTLKGPDLGRDMTRIQALRCISGAMWQRSPFGKLAHDRRGSPAIEFALVAPPLAALIVAVMQVSLVFFAQQNLETTAEKSVRQLLTGQAQQANSGAGLSQSEFKTLVCSKLPFFMKCANVIVDVRSATSFSNASTAAPTLTFDSSGNITNTWKYQPGGSDSINVARIMYVWNVQAGPLGFDISTMSNQRRLLIATAVFKTEHY